MKKSASCRTVFNMQLSTELLEEAQHLDLQSVVVFPLVPVVNKAWLKAQDKAIT